MSSPSAVPTENPIILNIMPTYGALLVGCFLSQAIWGISTLQVFFYFKNFEHDKFLLKLLVILLWLTDTTDQALLLKSGFKVFVTEYGRIANLGVNSIETTVHTWITCVVVFVVQLYFIRRIYLFGRRNLWIKVLIGTLFVLAVWQIVVVIVYWVKAFGKPLAEQGKPFYVNINISLRAAALVVDVAVALCMVWLLTWNQGPLLSQTKRMIFRILVVTINSGTWTALLAFMVLILLKVFPETLYFCIFEFSMCSLYFSTFMANLNSRNYVQGEGSITTIVSTGQSISNRNPPIALGPMTRLGTPSSNGNTIITYDSPSVLVTKRSEVCTDPKYNTKG